MVLKRTQNEPGRDPLQNTDTALETASHYKRKMVVRFSVFSKSGEWLLLNKRVDYSQSQSCPSCSSSSSSLCSHRVAMETPLAHTRPLLLPKPCGSPSPWFIFSALMFVSFVCYSMCWASMRAHAHHLGHKVSSVHGTWVLWFASSSLWSVRWWPWSNREHSSEIFSVFLLAVFNNTVAMQ